MQDRIPTGKRAKPKLASQQGRSVRFRDGCQCAASGPKISAQRKCHVRSSRPETTLTGNQKKIVAAAVIGDELEFFDYFLIGFVLAFIIGPWKLTFGQSAIVLMWSGIGAILGAYFWGWIADRIGRRKVFNGTVLNFSFATGMLAFTPDNGWIYLTVFRFVVGFGVGGLYCVDLPLVRNSCPRTSAAGSAGW